MSWFLMIAAGAGALASVAVSPGVMAGPAGPSPSDPNWGCYDAALGHPTPDEQRSFIDMVAGPAQQAERAGGPPAPGLIAMAALESGFGWTRTALFANNLFGWKAQGSTGPDGRPTWVLECQPASDPGKRYVVFKDWADSIQFVAGRLTSSSRYGSVTRQYHRDRSTLSIEEAVARWISGVAGAGYNPLPDYPRKVMALARNWRQPGSAGSADDSLFTYATTATSTLVATNATGSPPAGSANAAERAADRYLARRLDAARYLSVACGEPITDWPNYAGHPVRRCTYSVTSGGKTLSAIVYLMNPERANLAARIGDACASINLGGREGCGTRLATMIVGQNGGQFPVAGFVIERKKDAGGVGEDPVYLEFRDGVTVMTADRLNFTNQQLSDEAMEHAARAPVTRAQRFARIANADRAAYRRAGGTVDVGTSPASDTAVKWPGVIRDNEITAQRTGKDGLLVGVAKGMVSELSR